MPPVKRLPLLLVGGLVLVAVLIPVTGGQLGFGGSPSSPRPSSAANATADPTAGSSEATGAPTDPPAATPEAAPTSTEAPTTMVAIVPVTHFRSTRASTHRAEVEDVLAGRSERYEALELVADDADAILAALGVTAPTDPDRLVLADDSATLTGDLADHRKRLAFLRSDDIGPAVHALAWGDDALFGVGRVAADDWPLTAEVPAASASEASGDAAMWTLFAGGDILLDRGVHETIEVKGKGVDFPFDGGTAEITSRYCCSSFGWELPRTRRTGDDGAVRELIGGADLAIANFENPAPNKPKWHTKGTIFTADPDAIDGLTDAGIDYVSLANNHIGDAGRAGILQTIANLDDRGLAHGGAGANERAARRPATFEVGDGTTVAILAYDRIAKYYHADSDTPGSAPMTTKRVAADIKAAREDGADVVIVFPHWGTEYQYDPFSGQQAQAHDIIDAGADMIIGNHAHYAAAMEVYEGKPIWYALGNFVFDQTWSEPTMEGITLELTFRGDELAQADRKSTRLNSSH